MKLTLQHNLCLSTTLPDRFFLLYYWFSSNINEKVCGNKRPARCRGCFRLWLGSSDVSPINCKPAGKILLIANHLSAVAMVTRKLL